MDKLTTENKDLYFAGDYNIDLLSKDRNSRMFVNLFNSNALYPFIDKPTRITHNSSTLIDNIFSNTEVRHVASGIIFSDISDHLPIFVIINNQQKQNTFSNSSKIRKFTPQNIQSLQEDLNEESWGDVLACKNVDEAYKIFLRKIHFYFDKDIPCVERKRKHIPRKPWITQGIISSINKRNKLYKVSLEKPSQVNIDKYKQYRNKLTSIIRKSKQAHFLNKFENNRGNMSATWKTINDVLGKSKQINLNQKYVNGSTIYDKPDDIVNGFNDYFVNVGQNQASKIPQSANHFKDFLGSPCNSSIIFDPTTREEIFKIVDSFKNKTSCGKDEISNYLLKLIIPVIIDPIVYICNLSLSAGIFPADMKIAKVIPIYKKDDHSIISNYRPVSILSSFSKILERLVYNRLSLFLSTNNLLNSSQYGFRKNFSTDLALVHLFDRISSSLAQKEHVISVFMDLSKAFDTLDHIILFSKLEHFGVRGSALNWFKSYISNRQQYTCINSVCSHMQSINFGVPQGSILGPLLFLMYINDIVNTSSLLQFILFADDTTITFSHSNIKSLFDTLNNELPKISSWFKCNRLSLNLQKTHFINFKTHNTHSDFVGLIEIDGIIIEEKKNVKFLGIVLDEYLSWDDHIEKISTSISRCVGVLFKLKQYLPLKALITIYNTILLPHITYCNIVWGSYISKNNSILLLQKKAIRLCAGSGFLDHTDPLFYRFHTLKIDDIHALQIALFMYRYHSHQLPNTFDNMFYLNSELHNYPTRISFNVHLINPITALAHKSIKHTGPDIWNSIPLHIRSQSTINRFKVEYKKGILSNYEH